MRPVLLALFGLLLAAAPAAAEIRVVASIRPVHSLAAGLMDGIGTPALIVPGASSPHLYSLKPSEARLLEDADIVFWIGERLETFLPKPLEALSGKARIVTLSKAPGLTLLALREGGAFEDDDHGHDDHDDDDHDDDGGIGAAHADEATDMHLWLDPLNARIMIGEMAEALAAADPANESRYRANAALMQGRIEMLMRKVSERLAPVAHERFVVFHDAYHYFEHRFGLEAAGSLTVSPEIPPGVKRLREIRARITGKNVSCVFAEPQFSPALIDTVIEGTAARAGSLDPLGAALEDGPDLYFELIEGMAAAFGDCLSAG